MTQPGTIQEFIGMSGTNATNPARVCMQLTDMHAYLTFTMDAIVNMDSNSIGSYSVDFTGDWIFSVHITDITGGTWTMNNVTLQLIEKQVTQGISVTTFP